MKPFNFIGLFEIERATDIVALTAFVLSIAGLVYQISATIIGARLNIVSPEQARMYVNNDGYVTLIATIPFTNSGATGKNGVIMDVTVSLSLINESSYGWDWHKFVTTLEGTQDDGSPKRTGVNQQREDVETMPRSLMKVIEHSSSVPFVVHGGSAETREIWFMPRHNYIDDNGVDCQEDSQCISANYLSIDKFETLYATYLGDISGHRAKIPLRITATTLSDNMLDVECQLFLSQQGLEDLVHIGFTVLPCRREITNYKWLWFL